MQGPPAFSARQATLLAAAVRLVAASGLRGLTHRGVDREAGLPEGTCSAYLRTRLALLTRLTEYVSARFTDDIGHLTARIEEHAGEREYAVSRTVGMLRSWLEEPELLVVRMELSIEGARTPAVGAILSEQAERLSDVVEHALDVGGHEHGRVRAATLIAALDGVLLRALKEPPDRRTAVLEESVELLMGSLIGASDVPGC